VAIFQTKISKTRLTLSPFSSEQMQGVGNALLKSIKDRIKSGIDAKDDNAKPLKGAKRNYTPYSRQKLQKGLAPIRDWTYSGHTLRAMKVTRVNENGFKIGFIDDRSDKIAHANNQQVKMFAVSPNDADALKNALYNVFRTGNVIQFRKVA
jgi:hypothetical protein